MLTLCRPWTPCMYMYMYICSVFMYVGIYRTVCTALCIMHNLHCCYHFSPDLLGCMCCIIAWRNEKDLLESCIKYMLSFPAYTYSTPWCTLYHCCLLVARQSVDNFSSCNKNPLSHCLIYKYLQGAID